MFDRFWQLAFLGIFVLALGCDSTPVGPSAETAVEGVARLSGVLADDGHGGIRVEVVARNVAAVTTSKGGVRLGLPAGDHTLRFSYNGYGTQELSVTAFEGKTVVVESAVVLSGARAECGGSYTLCFKNNG